MDYLVRYERLQEDIEGAIGLINERLGGAAGASGGCTRAHVTNHAHFECTVLSPEQGALMSVWGCRNLPHSFALPAAGAALSAFLGSSNLCCVCATQHLVSSSTGLTASDRVPWVKRGGTFKSKHPRLAAAAAGRPRAAAAHGSTSTTSNGHHTSRRQQQHELEENETQDSDGGHPATRAKPVHTSLFASSSSSDLNRYYRHRSMLRVSRRSRGSAANKVDMLRRLAAHPSSAGGALQGDGGEEGQDDADATGKAGNAASGGAYKSVPHSDKYRACGHECVDNIAKFFSEDLRLLGFQVPAKLKR